VPGGYRGRHSMIPAKLAWYRAGGEVSERHWTDIAGLLTANQALDDGVLGHFAVWA
jgi:hypothetical protein